MFIRFSSVNSQKHFIAEIPLLIEPIEAFEPCCLLSLACDPSLEMFRLARFNLKFLVRISAILKLIQAEGVTQHHLNRSHSYLTSLFGWKYFDEAILSM